MPICNLHLKGPRPRVVPRGYTDSPQTLREHILKRRVDLGLLQREVAERIGVDKATIHNWERGLCRPPIRAIPAIIQFLGYDPLPAGQTWRQRLRLARVRLGLSLTEFGASIGFNEESVAGWEGGWRNPNLWTLGRLKKTLAHLEGGEGEESASGGPKLADETPAVGLLPTAYFDLTRYGRRLPAELLPESFGSLGDQIRFRRLELGLTQAELAERLKVGRMRILRWECGECAPSARLMPVVESFLTGTAKPDGPPKP